VWKSFFLFLFLIEHLQHTAHPKGLSNLWGLECSLLSKHTHPFRPNVGLHSFVFSDKRTYNTQAKRLKKPLGPGRVCKDSLLNGLHSGP
jgi:hypothetical protein